ncbi:MAG: alpha-glucosidase [Chitinophagales bacterium]
MSFTRAFLFFLIIGLWGNQTQAQNSEWWKHTSVYQIYPRSYKDSDGDGIGDLKGIISKLDYIKSLGVETIWFSPFYQSPQGDFGYDISDYRHADEDYGSNQDIDALIEAVHDRGMKIVFDLVLNHTSIEHKWFKESSSSRDNPKSDWYIWSDGQGKKPPNNWINVFNKDAWHYMPERDQWYYTAFLDFQPDLNWRNPEVKEAMFDIVRYWLGKGVDGFRLDIFNCIMEDENLSDNPFKFKILPSKDAMKARFQEKTMNINHPDNIALAKELRAVIDEFENPERFLVGEAIGPPTAIKPLLGDNQDGLNLVFLFDMVYFDFKAGFFRDLITEFEEDFPEPLMPTIVFGNHDQFRSMKRLDNSLEKAKLLALFQMTLRGVPVVYYGEEIGMQNADIKKKDALDPISHVFNGLPQFLRNWLPVPVNRDVCRTPMQWDTTAHAGFTSENAQPWLPISDGAEERNVAVQNAEENSLLNTYRELLDLRNSTDAFSKGSMSVVGKKEFPKNLLAYYREFEGEKYLILLNFSKKTQSIELGAETYKMIYGIGQEDAIKGKQANISGLGGLVLKIEEH